MVVECAPFETNKGQTEWIGMVATVGEDRVLATGRTAEVAADTNMHLVAGIHRTITIISLDHQWAT